MSKFLMQKLENIKWIKDEKAYRMFYSFKENNEIIKIELLNFTCCRLKIYHLKYDIFLELKIYIIFYYTN